MSMAVAGPSGIPVLDKPVGPVEKARYVRKMFDEIAPRYDLLNSLLSFAVHHRWRAYAARCAALSPGDAALDVCCGTGDFALALRRRTGPGGRIVAIDFSRSMLIHGRDKLAQGHVGCALADAMQLPFADGSFAAAVIAFRLRNVSEPARALAEMARTVRPGGRVVCVEFSEPRGPIMKPAYRVYSRWIMPALGGLVSGRREAYTYLPESVARWKSRNEITAMMARSGLTDIRTCDLSSGIVCVHTGTRV